MALLSGERISFSGDVPPFEFCMICLKFVVVSVLSSESIGVLQDLYQGPSLWVAVYCKFFNLLLSMFDLLSLYNDYFVCIVEVE